MGVLRCNVRLFYVKYSDIIILKNIFSRIIKYEELRKEIQRDLKDNRDKLL